MAGRDGGAPTAGEGSEVGGRGVAAAAIELAAIRTSRCSFFEAKELGWAVVSSTLGVRRVETSFMKSLLAEAEAGVVGLIAARRREVERDAVVVAWGAGAGSGVGAGGEVDGETTWSSSTSLAPPRSSFAGCQLTF